MSVVSQGLPPSYQEAQMLNAIVTTGHGHDDSGSGNPLTQTITTLQIQETDPNLEHEKRAIYRHPLFPLMALLFEKCEQATQTPDCPSSDSFDVDIQQFVHHQEKDRRPFFSDEPDLDGLMVKAIQVLRIHLLELEKVNDLCKDFCNRYITCLKGKLQSENLLRTDSPYDPTAVQLSPTGQSQVQMQQVLTPGGMTAVNQGNFVIQQGLTQTPVSMAALNQGQIVSGGTVYQMVQTPQGIVAQPIQIQTAPIQTQLTTTPIIHGSTPLSQIGVVNTPVQQAPTTAPSQTQMSNIAGQLSDSDEEDYLGKKKNKRGVLPKSATQVMKSWLFQHIVHPYPTEDEKRQIAGQTNLTLLQVNNWFINARRRILQPMLESSNPEQVKVKKSKPQNRPLQRFWPESLANLQPQLPPGMQTTAPSQKAEQENTTVSHSQMSSQGQQIILPAGSIVTADGQLISAGTGVALANLHGNNLSPMLGQVPQNSPPTLESHNESGSHNGDNDDSELLLDNSDSSLDG